LRDSAGGLLSWAVNEAVNEAVGEAASYLRAVWAPAVRGRAGRMSPWARMYAVAGCSVIVTVGAWKQWSTGSIFGPSTAKRA